MPHPAVNIGLAAAFAGTAALSLAIRTDPRVPNREALPEMVRTAAYDSFAPNPDFADGKTLRAPVRGTIMRPTRAAIERDPLGRGAIVFATFCQPCHGVSGKGDGTVAARGYPPPASLLAARAIALSDDEIFGIVTNGRNNMPAHASQISAQDRRSVILYVRSLQRKAVAK